MSDKLSALCNCASSGVSTAAMDKDLGKISPSAPCMEVTSSISLNVPGYSSKHPQVHNSFKIHTEKELLIMMLTLKALLTFSPLETILVPRKKTHQMPPNCIASQQECFGKQKCAHKISLTPMFLVNR